MSRPSYSVTVETNMIIEWELVERIESPTTGGNFRSLLTAKHAATNRQAQGLREGQRVAIRDSRWEGEHGYHKGYVGRCYKATYKPLTLLLDKRCRVC